VVKTGLVRNREEALTEAVNVFFAARPALRLEAAHPFFWASFVLVGQPN
jgi:CHAT domain-containing protein